MKEEWLFPEAVVPVDAETTAALVAEIHRLIDVVGGMALAQPAHKEQLLFEIDGEMLTVSQMMGVELFNFQEATGCDTAAEFLTQPKQEPVAWMTINEYGEEDDIHYENPEGHLLEGWTYKPLYTTPPTAQTEKEPLEYWNAVEGWVKIDEVRKHFGSVGCGTIYKTAGEDRVPVYTTPPQRPWVGLTDEDKQNLAAAQLGWEELIEAVEAKLKEFNT